jgi:hypothetical protein
MSLNATYSVRREDIAAFWHYTAKHDPARRRFWRVVRIVFVAFALVAGALVAAAQTDASSAIAAFFVVAGLILAVGHLSRGGARDYLFPVRLFVPEDQAPTIYGEHTLSVGESGLSLTFPSGSSTLAWSGITKLGQTDHHLFLFTAPNQAIVVPADSLHGCTLPELSAELRKYVEAAV